MTHDIHPQALVERLNWRYGTKLFDRSRRIPDADWDALLQALMLAPSSYGLQPWRFIQVDSPEIKERLAAAAPLNRSKIDTASHLVIVASLKVITQDYMDRHFDRFAAVRGLARSDFQAFYDMVTGSISARTPAQQAEWAARQTYVAVGAFATAAAVLGIDACPMEGIDPAAFDEILGLKETDYRSLVGLAAGYRSAEDRFQHAKKVRFARDDVLAVV